MMMFTRLSRRLAVRSKLSSQLFSTDIKLCPASSVLRLSNLGPRTKWFEVKDFLGENKSPFIHVSVEEDSHGRCSGTAWVRCESEVVATDLLEKFNGQTLGGSIVSIDYGSAKQEMSQKHSEENSRILFVGNLRFETSQAAVKRHFEQVAPVLSVRYHRFRDGRFRGSCHVEFQCQEDALLAAAHLKNTRLDGRALNVMENAGR